MYLYTLQLDHGYYYVGTTTNPQKRLQQHRCGQASEWTKRHKTVCLSSEYPLQKFNCSSTEARLHEDMHVKKVMMHYGIDKVRGGSYSSMRLSPAMRHMLQTELYHANSRCLRCGLDSHWVGNCYARTDVFGNKICSPQEHNDTDVYYSADSVSFSDSTSDTDDSL